MSRLITATPRPVHSAFQRKLALIAVLGTLLPLALLSLMFLLAPMPMTAEAADTLRSASRFAGAIVLVHWAVSLTVWAASKAAKPAPNRKAAWQDVKMVRRANA
jgi:uncharacterized BrkB/YihY/UPF0761 family membrane protein